MSKRTPEAEAKRIAKMRSDVAARRARIDEATAFEEAQRTGKIVPVKRGRGKPRREPYSIVPFSLSKRAQSTLTKITKVRDLKKTTTIETLIFEEAKRLGIAVDPEPTLDEKTS